MHALRVVSRLISISEPRLAILLLLLRDLNVLGTFKFFPAKHGGDSCSTEWVEGGGVN
jgi:hypothetical protein